MELPKPYFETELGRLYHGDCLEILPYLESVDLVLTDPPYSSGARQTNQIRARGSMLRNENFQKWFGTDNLSTAAFAFMMRGLSVLAISKAVIGSHFYCFIDWRNLPILSNSIESAGWYISNLIVWDKENFGMGQNYRNQHELIIFASKSIPRECNRHDVPNVLREKRKRPENHPTEKPIWLIRTLVEMSSKESELVFDPFAGSGTTAAACEIMNRKWIAIEIDEVHCENIAKRIEAERKQLKLF